MAICTKKTTPLLAGCQKMPNFASRPDGGIGRRDGLKHRWSNPSRFDPGSGYTFRGFSSRESSFILYCFPLYRYLII